MIFGRKDPRFQELVTGVVVLKPNVVVREN